MNLHSVFLRKECILPDWLSLSLQDVGGEWSIVEQIPALVFETMIRRAGWHFIWPQGACSRRGFGFNQQAATSHALLRALKGVPKQFNAAELDSVLIQVYPGFLVSSVTVQPLQIQQHTSLSFAGDRNLQPVPAR